MERHSLRAFLGIGVLVVLAWVGIALVGKLHNGGGMVALFVLWVVVVLGVLGLVLWSVASARRARIERRVEGSGARK
ncbi:MAG TPA: hypothetical protein VMD97_02970 [Candidatus Aquilonibacter sp.]|nr:hypothetical protein [Candidatus Aquilonibacter sp.]